MEHALQLPNPRRSLAIPLVAALLGAGAATAGFVLTDNEKPAQSKVVFVGSTAGDSNAQPTPMSGRRP